MPSIFLWTPDRVHRPVAKNPTNLPVEGTQKTQPARTTATLTSPKIASTSPHSPPPSIPTPRLRHGVVQQLLLVVQPPLRPILLRPRSRPYFDDSDDDDGDIKPSVVEHWHRDYNPYSGPVEDVKPAKKQPRPPSGGAGGAVAGRRMHDDDGGIGTALSWPVPEQFRSTLRTPESIAGLRSTYSIPDNFALLPAGPNHPACSPPSAPRGGRGAAAAVPIPVYAQAFAAGMRLPLHPFVSSALTHYGKRRRGAQ
ncbi:hypothetical protein PR202_gb06969 [Eleusine coracana subsp. coracana]|uniref:Uncharacterized protein n=1 Tax=Eleusine coracana subsp. coracana TaxID=191504 RepID=A0AAV5EAZ5_ELECO|nr:hypothetical protein PR202_gb06969 [Eleusine coracana subsp. coracana]